VLKFSDGQSEFSRVFNFVILGYSRNSRKLDAREKLVFYGIDFINPSLHKMPGSSRTLFTN